MREEAHFSISFSCCVLLVWCLCVWCWCVARGVTKQGPRHQGPTRAYIPYSHVFSAFSVTTKGRNWLLLSGTSAPHILGASYAAVWLRCGQFLISDPGASLMEFCLTRGHDSSHRSHPTPCATDPQGAPLRCSGDSLEEPFPPTTYLVLVVVCWPSY